MSDNRAMKLMEAFSGVDEELLERCERAVICEDAALQESGTKKTNRGKLVSLAEKIKKNSKKSIWQYGSACAAVICLAIVGLVGLSGLRVGVNDNAAYEAVTEGYMEADKVATTATGGAETAPAPSSVVNYTTAEAAGTEGTAGGASDSADNGSGNISRNSGEQNINDSLESADAEKVEKESSDCASDKFANIESEKNMSQDELGSGADAISCGSKVFTYAEVTEAEARVHEVFGVYVPTQLPAGYVFEGAYVSGESEDAALMVSWSRGMDSIMVNITLPEEAPATVDIGKIETYDEYLYEIPHAETVPEAYREVFNHPVCAWEDFSVEFVEKRMISRGGDAGDTDTPRGNFSVLYPDGVLVYFNGRGTAEEIWEMFASMKETKTEN